jgi:FAD/FMN-containing dehydrogenase
VATPADPLVAALVDIVGPEHVLTDPDVRAGYETDWTGRWRGTARAVVRPEHRGGVAQVLQACAAHGAAVVPQGGNTGLVGGSVPHNGEVVLSLRRLDHVTVFEDEGTIHADAGATLAAVHSAAAKAGWAFGVDLASRESATIGGMIATNAGGIHVVRHGMMRRQVVGLEAVLADGTNIYPRLDGLHKNNSGYDLAELLIGSEGTLGVIIGARLRLVPVARHRVTALVGLESVHEAVDLLPRLRALPSLDAAEIMFARGIHLVCMHTGLPLPFDPLPPVLLLVECADQRDPFDDLAGLLRDCLQVAVAVEGEDRRRLWAYRERHTEAINAFGVPLKFDVGVALSDFAHFTEELDDDLGGAWPDAIVIMFGHLADGNVHLNVLPPESPEGIVPDLRAPTVAEVEELVLRRVTDYRGAISAEHGIGVAKKDWLARSLDPEELAAMRKVKAALDPTGLLNPNVLF